MPILLSEFSVICFSEENHLLSLCVFSVNYCYTAKLSFKCQCVCVLFIQKKLTCINFYMLRFYVQINVEQELFTETGRCRLSCSMHSLISPFPPPVTNTYSFHSRAAWVTVIIYVTMYFWQCFSNCLISH